ncbi:hypothetical protein U9M48_036579 [Paspalum notatum var. saurae]|uniref:Tf2-1-like SH3-like domain-containing protein n=1 Tax=Paspalum notatum var. saurae TaxID=547442 RepID=A0AAQ3X9P5_PASNO
MPNFLTTTVIRLVSRYRLLKLCTADDAERRYIGISPKMPNDSRRLCIFKSITIRGLRRFKVKEKLAPRYIGPFKIIDRKGEVAYQLELPDRLSEVHDVFHVSQLKKCLRLLEEQLQMDDFNVQDDLTYAEYPVQILKTAERVTRKRVIKMCKVKRSHHSAEEAT